MRYALIDHDIWESDKFYHYTPQQIAIYFYFRTNQNVTSSGVYKISPLKICDRFGIELDEFTAFMNTLSSNVEYDPEEKLVFVIHHLEKDGLRRGNPRLIGKAIRNDMKKYPQSKLWNTFTKVYPMFSNVLSAVQSEFSASMSKYADFSEDTNASTPQNLTLNSLDKVFTNFAQTIMNMNMNPGGKEGDKEGGLYKGETSRGREGGHLYILGDEKIRSQLLEFFRNRLSRRPLTENAMKLIINELATISGGDTAAALDILLWTNKNSYLKLVEPPADQKSPRAVSKSKATKHQRKIESAVAASSLPCLEAALTEYASDTGRESITTEDIINENDTDGFCRWLSDHFSPEKKPSAPPVAPAAPPNPPAENTDDDDDTAPFSDALHPLLAKARDVGITPEEYKQVPFLFQDQVLLDPTSNLYRTPEKISS